MIKPGLNFKLTVLRRTDIGYMLKDDKDEIFLHQNEATKELKENEEVNVFIYFDKKKRIAATMHEALITIYKPNWVSVVDVKPDLGVFVNIGISKDILIPTDYLPYNTSNWPLVGDKLFCILKAKKDSLNAKIVNSEDAKLFAIEEKLNIGDSIDATITKVTDSGIGLYTDNLTYIFVNKNYLRGISKLGERVNVEIIKINDDRISGKLIKNKEFMIDSDIEIIKNYLLKAKDNKMKFGNDSSPEDILKTFKMSKKAFKRALGGLYKNREIDFVDGYTILKK